VTSIISNIKYQKSNRNTPKATTTKAKTMEDLMRSAKTSFVALHKGGQVSGIITKLTPSEILVDINAKTEAVVLEKDKKILKKILSTIKAGDKVEVTVLNPESDDGNPVVSLRRSIEDAVWEKLNNLKKSQEVLELIVASSTKGGFLVTTTDGVSGFLPNSHISILHNPQNLIGKKIKAVVLELSRPLHKIIFSQRQSLGIKDFEKLVKEFKVGQKIDASVYGTVPFGIFVSMRNQFNDDIEGFVHISEIQWGDGQLNISEEFPIGKKITAAILGIDGEGRRINLSIRKLTHDPFEEKLKDFPADKKLKAKVSKIIPSGVLFDLGEGLIGIIKREKIPANVSYKEGSEVQVLVSSVDEKRHRIILSPILKEKPIGYR
jgi:small subunit ribosomal protein S1